MDDSHRMQILQPARRFCKLRDVSVFEDGGKIEMRRTRRRRLTSGCFEVKSMMFPSIIHSVTMHNGKSFGETPSTGRTFGWERRLQITISWNKRYRGGQLDAHYT